MKFGMNLLLWTGELNEDIKPVLEMLKGLGYDGVELTLGSVELSLRRTGGPIRT